MSPKKSRPQKKACDVCYRRKREATKEAAEQRIDRLERTLTRTETTDEQNVPSSGEPVALVSPEANSPRISRRPCSSNGESTASARSTSPAACVQASTTPSGHPTSDRSRKDTTLVNQLGPNWFFNGIPISSEGGHQWISSRTDQPAEWIELSIPINTSPPLSKLPPYSLQEACELPDKDSTRKILNFFFRSSPRLMFPVLDEVLFESTIETAYAPSDKAAYSPSQIAARSCVFSALSIASHLDMSGQMPVSLDADTCADKAHYLLTHITGDGSLETLQTAIMLQLRYAFHAHWQGAALLHSITCRIVCSLQGHTCQPSKSSGVQSAYLEPEREREKSHVRLLFWLCYMLDKDISLRTGNPPLLIDEYCDLTPPNNHLDSYTYVSTQDRLFENDDDRSGNSTLGSTAHLPGDIYLCHLKEKVYRLLLSARALKDNDNQLVLNIRQLDNEVEHWRLSIPINFRPALFVSQNSASNISDEDIPHTIRRIALQLEYHHLMTVIHTTVRRCTAEASDGTRDLHDVVHSSFDISLMASRSTLWCLRYLIGTIADQAFRLITFYSIPAALSLFLNIVIHPIDPQVQLDLELLMSAANSIRSIPMSTLTGNEIDLIHHIGDFAVRLVWLGSCAVMKAKRQKEKQG
ncbi:hypothetical protein N7456_012758 [Penicillium angulare]|uniref:Xylanolytic transcriptional activator regulatory domain-containing protein n=1 Tax=Penicillium angulare TaxID=116970 RepID=A0A9W9EK64_9EURO|nr:hypothetical protein N7456_012758 [Penicillium angulare]